MRIFVTGASGYIGQVVTELALARGHQVMGLARTRESYLKLQKLGAESMLGDLGNTEELERVAREVDAVLHLAFIHDWNSPFETALATERSALDSLGRGMEGSGKPLVMTSGTAVVEPDPAGGETDELAPSSDTFALAARIKNERHAHLLANRGIRLTVLRLPPYVYGRGGSTFIPLLMEAAAKSDVSLYIGEGEKRTSAVHVDDAARCYLDALERAPGGSVYNCTSQTDITTRQMAEAIAAALDVPARGVSRAEAEQFWGPFLTGFVDFENRASSAKARAELGWTPQEPLGLLEDIVRGSYRDLAARLRAKFAAGKPQV